MSEIDKINYCLSNGILPPGLSYTSYYHSPDFFREKYACLQNLPHSDGIFEEMARNIQIEGITPLKEMEERQQRAKDILETDIIENEQSEHNRELSSPNQQ